MLLRRFLTCLLAGVIALASVGFAAAPRVSGVGEELVICHGNTITTIVIGPDGTPVERVHLCPDYGFAQAALLPAPALPVHPAARCRRLPVRHRPVPAGRRRHRRCARAPPAA